ncbi:MAG: phospholipase D family protein [Planctomycetota bacterium]|jgi:phosphatidylserine/phosphatidylglycerophosphate/cardiolipin synthase-like enzyme
MPSSKTLSNATTSIEAPLPANVELVIDDRHLQRVVLDGILKAQTSLDIATADFKAMLVPTPAGKQARSIVKIFRRLIDQGVEIRLLHSGIPSRFVLQELRQEIPEGLNIRRCPRMHAKAVIIDCRYMYLGSANLTGSGLGAKSKDKRNFEIGIWTRAPHLVDPVLDHFNTIWEARHCQPCRRKNLCPIPLEEPDLT